MTQPHTLHRGTQSLVLDLAPQVDEAGEPVKLGPSLPDGELLETRTVRVGPERLSLRYAELGDRAKPTLLLLHGVPENLQAWYAVAPLLASDYHVVAIDWPGFGGSSPLTTPGEYTSRRFAQILVEFMDELDIAQADLVATDISLLVALLVAWQHPHRVRRLAVMDGIPFYRPQFSSWELKSFAKRGSVLGQALVRGFPKVSAQLGYTKGFYRGHSIPAAVLREFAADGGHAHTQKALLAYFQNFRVEQEFFEPYAHELDTEVLVLWGSHDRFISPRLGEEIARTLKNSGLQVVDRAGHYVHMDKPRALAVVVRRFLKTGLSPEQRLVPRQERAARAPAKYKVALLIWAAVFPTVLVTSTLLSWLRLQLPLAANIFLTTATAIPLVVYFVMPALERGLRSIGIKGG